MAGGTTFFPISLKAAADFSTKQFYFVKIDNTGQAALAGAAQGAIGVLQNMPSLGEMCTVETLGIAKTIYGNTITAGDPITPDALGKAAVAAAGEPVVGVALAGGVAGDIGQVLLITRSGVAAVNQRSVLSFPFQLASIANGDLITNFVPGYAGRILSMSFAVTVPATTALKLATLNLEVNTTNLTGGVLAMTSANMTPAGNVVNASAITAGNIFTATDSISVEASSVTAFVEGSGVLLIVLG